MQPLAISSKVSPYQLVNPITRRALQLFVAILDEIVSIFTENKNMKIFALLALLALSFMPSSALAASEGIGWIASWDQGVAEARATNKPILLMSGQPSCGGVPGVW